MNSRHILIIVPSIFIAITAVFFILDSKQSQTDQMTINTFTNIDDLENAILEMQ